jgi:hypothetical protein
MQVSQINSVGIKLTHVFSANDQMVETPYGFVYDKPRYVP